MIEKVITYDALVQIKASENNVEIKITMHVFYLLKLTRHNTLSD